MSRMTKRKVNETLAEELHKIWAAEDEQADADVDDVIRVITFNWED